MVTRADIISFFGVLITLGVLAPEPWRLGTVAERRAANDLAIRIWLDVFADVRAEAFHAACRTYLDHGDKAFWPMPGLIRRMVLEARGDHPLSVDEVTTAIFARASRLGREHPPDRRDYNERTWRGIQAGLAAVGGWWGICTRDVTEALTAQFRRSYEAGAEPDALDLPIGRRVEIDGRGQETRRIAETVDMSAAAQGDHARALARLMAAKARLMGGDS